MFLKWLKIKSLYEQVLKIKIVRYEESNFNKFYNI